MELDLLVRAVVSSSRHREAAVYLATVSVCRSHGHKSEASRDLMLRDVHHLGPSAMADQTKAIFVRTVLRSRGLLSDDFRRLSAEDL